MRSVATHTKRRSSLKYPDFSTNTSEVYKQMQQSSQKQPAIDPGDKSICFDLKSKAS